jgi:hypothetical protein
MSAKVAVIIGDYANGWSDAVIVQDYVPKIKQDQILQDRPMIHRVMNEALIRVIAEIERNETINPKPKDEPCCDSFAAWAKKQIAPPRELKVCPFCGTEITNERRAKFLTCEE